MAGHSVSVQLGDHANHLGSHLWNLRTAALSDSEFPSDFQPTAFFRESSRPTPSRPRYTPRLQIIDATSAFGALSVDTSSLHHPAPSADTSASADAPAAPIWNDSPSVYARPPIPAHPLSSNHRSSRPVRYWSDYLSAPLHPTTCHALPSVHYGVTDTSNYASLPTLVSSCVQHDLLDATRRLVEDCDVFSSLLLLTSSTDLYGALSAALLPHLQDDLAPSASLLLSAHPTHYTPSPAFAAHFAQPHSRAAVLPAARAEARLFDVCAEHSVQYIPLSTLAASALPTHPPQLERFYCSSAPLSLSVYAALSPLSHLAPSSLLSTIRSSSKSLYSSLLARLPPSQSLSARLPVDPFCAEGLTNLSNVWLPQRIGRLNAPPDSQWQVLNKRPRFVSGHGLSQSHSLDFSTPGQITLPNSFPDVLDPHPVPSQGKPSPVPISKVSLVAGLVDDREAAIAAMKGLRSSFDRVPDVARLERIDTVALEELQENYATRIDDLQEE